MAREELGVARGALAGRVSIGLPPSLSRLITVPLTQAFRAKLPQAQLTLTEGKYHQVKRMVAAVGNRVEALHRSRIGGLALPADLAPGEWRWLCQDELASLKTA